MHYLNCACKRTTSFVSFIPLWILFTVMLDTIPLFNLVIYCYTLNRIIQFVRHITRNTMIPTIYYRTLISPFEESIIKLRITSNFLQEISQINSLLKSSTLMKEMRRQLQDLIIFPLILLLELFCSLKHFCMFFLAYYVQFQLF